MRREKRPILFDTIVHPDEKTTAKKSGTYISPSKKIKKFADSDSGISKIKTKKQKESKNKKAKSKRPFNHHIRIALTALATVVVLNTILLGGVVFGFPALYKNQVLPGVYVLGQHMGGKYDPELKKVVREKLDETKITFKIGEKEEAASLYDLGVKIPSDGVAINAFSYGRSGNFLEDAKARSLSFLYWLSPEYYPKYLKVQNTEIPYSVENEKITAYSKNIFEKYKTPEKNASVIIKGSDIEVLPAQFGEKIIIDSLDKQIGSALSNLKEGGSPVVSLTKEKIMPGIKEEGLTTTVNKTREITSKNITLTFEDKKYSPTKEVVASWITFEEGQGTLNPKLDQKKIEGYLSTLAKNINIEAVPKKIKVENGVKETVEQEGKEGRTLSLADNASKIKASLESGSAVIQTLTVVKIPPKEIKNRVLVADWAKYIDIDLAAQRMTAYEDKKPVFTDLITSGKRGYETPTGTFLIYSKTRAQTMKGGTGAEYYYLPNVQWISWFNGEIAIHGAYWRTNFGGSDYVWSGSHGCINARNSSAEWIFNWAPNGTPVIVHY